MHDFKRLRVWSAAMDLAAVVYEATKSFPADERFGLTKQMRRSSVSVPSNLAEGCGRNSDNELAYFTGIAMGSIHELETQCLLSVRLGLLPPDHPVHAQLQTTKAMLFKFRAWARQQPAKN